MIAAIVPAAGRSLRMGRPKLILPLGGVPVIVKVVNALLEGGAATVVVVVAPGHEPGASRLAEEAARAGAEIVVAPEVPPDMRGSVELGRDWLGKDAPTTVLLTPGDHPGISAALVARIVLGARNAPDSIVVPVSAGKRGHPVSLPWTIAEEVRRLPAGVGINTLVARHADQVIEIEVADPDVLSDLDTPEDYQRWANRSRIESRNEP